MAEAEVQPAPSGAHRIRFTLGSLLLWIVVVALAMGLFANNRQLAQTRAQLAETENELASLRPLAVEEVARQFERCTTLVPIRTTVRDVRYSPNKDAYRIEFSWINSQTKQRWTTEVQLDSDGFGGYYGVIRSDEFNKPLGRTDGYTVAVKAPSPFSEK